MRVVVRENITIENCTDEAQRLLCDKLVFANPDYAKKVSRGLWLGNTPKELALYERDGNNLVVPFGMLPLIFRNKNIFGDIENGLKIASESFLYGSNIIPYEYQERAITEALKAKQGIIVAPCGSGKTQIGLEIAARIGKRTLWLTHTSDLLNQSMARAKSVFDLSANDYGVITGGKVDIGRVMTFATVQTMCKLKESSYKDKFDVVIVDEAHHCVGTPTQVSMFYSVISSINARWKYGLTATPKRADGLIGCMYALLGDKICEISKDDVKDTTCPVEVLVRETGYTPDVSKILETDGTLSFVKLINEIVQDEDRNDLIVQDAITADGTCLILTDRVNHVNALKKAIEAHGVPVISIIGCGSKIERKRATAALNNKEVKVAVATYALAKEGLDIPTLEFVILATPQKNEVTVVQSAGRVGRKAEGKDHGTVVDYCDDFPMLRGWLKKRMSFYRKSGFLICE